MDRFHLSHKFSSFRTDTSDRFSAFPHENRIVSSGEIYLLFFVFLLLIAPSINPFYNHVGPTKICESQLLAPRRFEQLTRKNESFSRKRSGSASGMSFADHVEAIKKEMSTMSGQIGQNKTDLERSRQEIGQIQLQLQQVNGDPAVQAELHKAKETASKLEALAKTFLATISDPGQQAQLLAELESISKNGTPQMPGMTPPMMSAAAAAAAMQPHMMMRNPMMSGASPRVGKGAPPNGNMHMMQMQMAAQQAMAQQAMAQAMMQAQMFHGALPMMAMPGMMPGMPPGMAGLPGMMPPNAAAMAAAAQAQMAAAAIAVSTPSRNPSTSGAASRTRTPLTASATNSPRPVTEPTIKEEEPPSMETDTPVASAAATIKQEENSTVAVA